MQNKSSLFPKIRRKTSKFTNIYLNYIIKKIINRIKLNKRILSQNLAPKKHYCYTYVTLMRTSKKNIAAFFYIFKRYFTKLHKTCYNHLHNLLYLL